MDSLESCAQESWSLLSIQSPCAGAPLWPITLLFEAWWRGAVRCVPSRDVCQQNIADFKKERTLLKKFSIIIL